MAQQSSQTASPPAQAKPQPCRPATASKQPLPTCRGEMLYGLHCTLASSPPGSCENRARQHTSRVSERPCSVEWAWPQANEHLGEAPVHHCGMYPSAHRDAQVQRGLYAGQPNRVGEAAHKAGHVSAPPTHLDGQAQRGLHRGPPKARHAQLRLPGSGAGWRQGLQFEGQGPAVAGGHWATQGELHLQVIHTRWR